MVRSETGGTRVDVLWRSRIGLSHAPFVGPSRSSDGMSPGCMAIIRVLEFVVLLLLR